MLCQSIKSFNEAQFRCLFRTREDEKYCPLHLSHRQRIDYHDPNDAIMADRDIVSSHTTVRPKIFNSLRIESIECDQILPKRMDHTKEIEKEIKKSKSKVLDEETVSTVENVYKETELDNEVKLLMLLNEKGNMKLIEELIGPVFKDVTLSEDECDPIMMTPFWESINGKRVPVVENKYHLFSYMDKKKLRCLNIFSIFNMKDYVHPITHNKFPKEAIDRAKKLIKLYDEKIQLFTNHIEVSPEYTLKNRVVKLFKSFQNKTIFFEDKWLLDIDSTSDLRKIIDKCRDLTSSNVKDINPNLHKDFKFFSDKLTSQTSQSMKEYIITNWEKMVANTQPESNQMSIWIIGIALSTVAKEVKETYPDIQYMIE